VCVCVCVCVFVNTRVKVSNACKREGAVKKGSARCNRQTASVALLSSEASVAFALEELGGRKVQCLQSHHCSQKVVRLRMPLEKRVEHSGTRRMPLEKRVEHSGTRETK
jgi:hypothetical protein